MAVPDSVSLHHLEGTYTLVGFVPFSLSQPQHNTDPRAHYTRLQSVFIVASVLSSLREIYPSQLLIGTAQNKKISDDTDPILKMQGVSWFIRNAIYYSTIVLHVKEYTDDAGNVHIDIEQALTGGIKSLEERTLDWTDRDKDDRVFGKVKGRTRFVKSDDIPENFLRNGWDDKSVRNDDGLLIQSYVESRDKDPNWTADQIWGFEIVEGKRRYVRHVYAKKGKEEHRVKLVYDWTPGA